MPVVRHTGEQAARSYTSVFSISRITNVSYYGETAPRAAGTVITVSFELGGHEFFRAGQRPRITFSEAISFQVMCDVAPQHREGTE